MRTGAALSQLENAHLDNAVDPQANETFIIYNTAVSGRLKIFRKQYLEIQAGRADKQELM